MKFTINHGLTCECNRVNLFIMKTSLEANILDLCLVATWSPFSHSPRWRWRQRQGMQRVGRGVFEDNVGAHRCPDGTTISGQQPHTVSQLQYSETGHWTRQTEWRRPSHYSQVQLAGKCPITAYWTSALKCIHRFVTLRYTSAKYLSTLQFLHYDTFMKARHTMPYMDWYGCEIIYIFTATPQLQKR